MWMMVPLLSAAAAVSAQLWRPVPGHISTRWAKDVMADEPLPEYPRPQMVRTQWQSLNGLWDCTLATGEASTPPTNFDTSILVPYPYESSLSGVGKESIPNQRIWYRRSFTVPNAWSGQRVMLHFGAVNWDSSVLLNGRSIGTHRGGYDSFEFDITNGIRPGSNELIVSAQNPLRVDTEHAQVVGKQRLHHSGIFYTGCTGMWQTVWLEPVPAAHISGLKAAADIDSHSVRVMVSAEAAAGSLVTLTALDGVTAVATATGAAGADISLPIDGPHLWSPEDPYLYGLRITLSQDGKEVDHVTSYFAMRKVSLGKDDKGRTRIFLNNHFVFEVGALDQGYWPDGIYTAPTDEALQSDIIAAKELGFNLLRKHAKVEPERWYYWADKLGILVWQDMPQAFDRVGPNHQHIMSDAAKAQWLTEWKRILAQRGNHPSIIVWTTFNEGWGQHDTEDIVALTKQIDPSRLVNAASGWNDKKVGDIRDTHAYPGPWCEAPEPNRASVNGEFGGLTMRAADHMWTADVFGYGSTLKSDREMTQKYQKLLRTAFHLRDERGASAFVYTQLTDVEQESNGLLTYDRAVVKPIAKFIAAANRGEFIALPSGPTSQDQKQDPNSHVPQSRPAHEPQ
jgi:beta-galactosidase/beta-glucuronidase